MTMKINSDHPKSYTRGKYYVIRYKYKGLRHAKWLPHNKEFKLKVCKKLREEKIKYTCKTVEIK